MVLYRVDLVARDGNPIFIIPKVIGGLTNTINCKTFNIDALMLSASAETMAVIEIVPGQIITRKRLEKIKAINGIVTPFTSRDILKLVVERLKATGNIGLGLLSGFGLKKGALASSIAHDSHNIIAVGANDEDIFTAINEIERLEGGLVAAAQGKVLASLALTIAGLLSPQSLEVVVSKLEELGKISAELGTRLVSPFATLFFLALPVIPEIRLTDRGLVES
jgi:adenine deaminase